MEITNYFSGSFLSFDNSDLACTCKTKCLKVIALITDKK